MKYEKPEIKLVDAAANAIQGLQSKQGITPDGMGHNEFVTSPAYEADE